MLPNVPELVIGLVLVILFLAVLTRRPRRH